MCMIYLLGGRGWTGSDVEAGVDLPLRRRCLAIYSILRHKVAHSTTCNLDRLVSIKAVFRLTRKFWVLKLIESFYSTMTSYISKVFQFMTPLKSNLFLWSKAEFSESLLQSSVSHDPSEIILKCWFAAQETLLIIMLHYMLKIVFKICV